MKKSMYKSKDELPMFLSVMDLADLLGISRASAYELVNEEEFPKLKIVQGRTIINGKRISKNVYSKTREECEQKLSELIVQMKAEIAKLKKKNA